MERARLFRRVDDADTFHEREGLVGRKPLEAIRHPAGPANVDAADHLGATDPEVEAAVVVRDVAPAAPHLGELTIDRNACSDGTAVAVAPDQAQPEPAVPVLGVVSQKARASSMFTMKMS